MWNTAIGTSDDAEGGGLRIVPAGDHGSLVARGVNLQHNDAPSPSATLGRGVFLDTVPTSWTHCNAWSGSVTGIFEGMQDPTGSFGNIAADVLYTALGPDPSVWDLTLTSGSPSLDAGPAGELDADGTPADIGAYGGPDGVWP